MKRTAV